MPLLSPRETKGWPLAAIAFSALSALPASRDFRRIVLRADEDEIVVHHVLAVAAVAFGDELVLGGAVVHEQHVGVAAAADVQRLTGADGDDADLDPGRLLEFRQNPAEQAGLLGGGG